MAASRIAHEIRVAENHLRHGPGHELADRMRAHQAAAGRDETAGSPGWRTFFWVAVVGGIFIAAAQQAPHDGRWQAQLVFGGAIILGMSAWLVRYAVFRHRRRVARTTQAFVTHLSEKVGCGRASCTREPCASYRQGAPTG